MSTYGHRPTEPSGQPGASYYGTQPPAHGGPGYGAPAYGAPPPGWGYQPVRPKSPLLGLVTLVVLVVAMVIGTTWTAFAYPELKAYQDAGQPESAMTGSLVAYALGCVALWLVGVTTFILGIVATATGRGRAWGIVSIVLSVLAPLLTLGIGAALSGTPLS